ncbi:hypothetical protein [Seohaeicola zhoushanensis]|nr:hypothetical protein [Seohaeicola zhoushanensis]
MRNRFKSPADVQRFVSIFDPIANLFHLPRSESKRHADPLLPR